jgi:hypothetical protein
VHEVDPLARQLGKSSEVLGRREPLRLKAPHLTRRSRAPLRRFAADNPAHSSAPMPMLTAMVLMPPSSGFILTPLVDRRGPAASAIR